MRKKEKESKYSWFFIEVGLESNKCTGRVNSRSGGRGVVWLACLQNPASQNTAHGKAPSCKILVQIKITFPTPFS